MMRSKIFAIYDNKAEAFMQPYFAHNAAVGTRTFSDNVQNHDTIFNKHPNDFVLFEIAEFDDQTGEITPHKQNINLGLAIDYLQTQLKAAQ